jgi:hypothetical protein
MLGKIFGSEQRVRHALNQFKDYDAPPNIIIQIPSNSCVAAGPLTSLRANRLNDNYNSSLRQIQEKK